MRPWILVENHDMFAFTGTTGSAMRDRIMPFLFDRLGSETFSYIFNYDEITNVHYWHLYYHTPINEADPADQDKIHTAGTIEIRQKLDDGVGYRADAFEWRKISEAEGPMPYFTGLPMRVLYALTNPPPSREAEAWRYCNWRARGHEPIMYEGMGVTYHVGSDRYPYVITKIPRGKSIVIAPVAYKIKEGHTQSEGQVYEFGGVEGNQEWLITPSRRRGEMGHNVWRFSGGGGYYTVGMMSAYRDPSY